jgi:hypothetical protein
VGGRELFASWSREADDSVLVKTEREHNQCLPSYRPVVERHGSFQSSSESSIHLSLMWINNPRPIFRRCAQARDDWILANIIYLHR